MFFSAALAPLYFWFPKMFGRMMNETLGKIHFWLTFAFFNLIFGPMHLVGLGGMMRRIANPTQYDFLKPVEPLNIFITLMAIFLILSQIVFVINFFWSLFAGKVAAGQSLASQHLGVDHQLTAAARELRRDTSGVSGRLRIQLAGSKRRLVAAESGCGRRRKSGASLNKGRPQRWHTHFKRPWEE